MWLKLLDEDSLLKVRPGLSVRTALVYAGHLAKSVRSSGSFDAIVSAEELFA